MTNEREVERLSVRFDEFRTSVNQRLVAMAKDIGENAGQILRLDDMLRGNGGGAGLRAKVEENHKTLKEIRFYFRTMVVLFLGEIVAAVIYILSIKPQ